MGFLRRNSYVHMVKHRPPTTFEERKRYYSTDFRGVQTHPKFETLCIPMYPYICLVGSGVEYAEIVC